MIKQIWKCEMCNTGYEDKYEALDCYDNCVCDLRWDEKINERWQCHCGEDHFTELEAREHCDEQIETEVRISPEQLEKMGQQRLIP